VVTEFDLYVILRLFQHANMIPFVYTIVQLQKVGGSYLVMVVQSQQEKARDDVRWHHHIGTDVSITGEAVRNHDVTSPLIFFI